MKKTNFRGRLFSVILAVGLVVATIQPALAEELLPPAPEPKQEQAKDEQISRRRSQLTWHQGLGYALLPTMAATAVLGQLHYNDVINGAGTDKYRIAHLSTALTAAALFAANAILAYTAPEPFEKKAKLDTTTAHKWIMTITGLAMAAQIGLGIAAKQARGTPDEADLAQVHLGMGYAIVGLTFTGAAVHLF